MSRLQLALNVDDLEQSIAFYSALFGAEPAKRKPGYANFAVADPPLKLVLIENPGEGGSVNHLGVEVADTESGIPEEMLERIFVPFETTKATGMGMGLAVCRTIIQAHGGRIWDENVSPGGARVSFDLPLQG